MQRVGLLSPLVPMNSGLGFIDMDKIEKIAVLEDELQARLLEAVLKDRGIPHVMHSYYSSAYDGIFQLSSGWGHIEAPARYKEEILAAIQDIQGMPPPSEKEPCDDL